MFLRRQSRPAVIKKVAPLLVLLLAFGLQMLYLAELRRLLPGSFTTQPFCGVDAVTMVNRAAGLLDGSAPGNQPFPFIPLYPIYLAALKIIAGDSLLLPVVVQALLQLVGLAALYAIGRLVYSPGVGMLAALGLAGYSYYLYYLPCFDQSLLTLPALTLSIYLVLRYRRRPRWGWLLAAGLTLAAAALSRPTTLLLYPVILLWLHLARPTNGPSGWTRAIFRPQHLRRWLVEALLLVVPFIIAVAPITGHNYRSSGRFILISDNFGVNLFTGNNPDATGLDTLAHVQGQPGELRFREMVKREERGETTLTREALRYILSQPGDWLALTAAKSWLLFGQADEPLVSPYFPLLVRQSRLLSALPVEWQAAIVVALLGLLLVRAQNRQQEIFLWLVYGAFSAATLLFFVQLRFRLPLAPFVMLLAATLPASAPAWRRESPQKFWATLLILLALLPLLPGLWLFIALFVGLGLWLDTRPGGQSKIIITLAVSLYLLAAGWWVKADALASTVSQEIDHYLGPPLAGSGILGQSFQMDCDGLNRIEVTLGLLTDRHDRPVTFYLAADSSAQEVIYSETFDAATVSDYQRKVFTFPPIADSAGRSFFFFINSPTSTPDNAITARGYTDTPVDRYPAGNAFAGQPGALQTFQADFAFAAYCDMSRWEKLQAVLRWLL